MHPRLSVSENYMFNKSIFYDTDFGGIISFLDFEEIGVFAHEVCDVSVRDKAERWILLSGSSLTRKNSYHSACKDCKSDTYLREGFCGFC